METNGRPAFCGLICEECPALRATRADDTAGLQKCADDWSVPGHPLAADDCRCDGCRPSGRLYMHCALCRVRACALEKGVENCAHCSRYACEELKHLWRDIIGVDKPRLILDDVRREML